VADSRDGKAIGEAIGRVAIDGVAMIKLRIFVAATTILASSSPIPAFAQDPGAGGPPGLRSTTQSGFPRIIWYFDGRDDTRDFPTNGFFPGDFAANPASAAIGAAGLFGSTPSRTSNSYPSQSIVGSQHALTYCARRYRSYDRASGTFLGNDGVRHQC
jgi:hypothetical protein